MTERDEAQVLLLMERLDAFPAQDAAPDGTLIPVPPQSRRKFAELIYDKGARVHVEDAVLVPLPGDQPGMGMWNYTRWVACGEADVPAAESASDVPGDLRVAVMTMLERVNPELAEQIRDTPEDELPALRDALERQVPDALRHVQRINEDIAADVRGKKASARRGSKKRGESS